LKRFWLYGLYGLPLLAVAAALAFKIFQPIQVLPRIRLAPAFSMVDQYGNVLTNEDLRGSLVLYAFTYTRCPQPCGGMDETLLEVAASLNELELNGIPVRLVTISFDPQYDIPRVLAEAALRSGADGERWLFATLKDPALLKTVIGAGFEVYYQQLPDESFEFDPAFVLVDGWGIIRGEYHYQTVAPDARRISRHIGVLAQEVEKSQGAARLAYEAAHLFLCYTP
jgi:protein SCO1/2